MHQLMNTTNIVELIEFFSFGGKTYIVTKFVTGGNLAEYLISKVKKSPEIIDGLSETMACHIIYQISKGIQQVHQQSFAHRNLNFENIFLSDLSHFPTVKIGDFSQACPLDESGNCTASS